jgi:hypothetical protein
LLTPICYGSPVFSAAATAAPVWRGNLPPIFVKMISRQVSKLAVAPPFDEAVHEPAGKETTDKD